MIQMIPAAIAVRGRHLFEAPDASSVSNIVGLLRSPFGVACGAAGTATSIALVWAMKRCLQDGQPTVLPTISSRILSGLEHLGHVVRSGI
jgi:hypothetical protein